MAIGTACAIPWPWIGSFSSESEAVKLGAAQREPAHFNKATASPKDGNGSVKRSEEWSLARFTVVACEIDLVKTDAKS